MRNWYRFGAAIFVVTIAAVGPHYDWSTADLSYYGDASEYAQTRKICSQLMTANPSLRDGPSAGERKTLRDCDSEALYYGIGVPADPTKARKCAILERELKGDQNVNYFVAEGTLMTIYSNGRGAQRNFEIAIHMACQLEDAPAATDGRIKHLSNLKRQSPTGGDFSPCDDATSGMSSGVCADHDATLAQQARERRIAILAKNWTQQQRAAFERVYKSFTDYADTAHQMDCWRGTLQSACTISAREGEVELFLSRIEILNRGQIPKKEEQPEDGLSSNAKADSEWIESFEKEERAFYDQNARETASARRKFEYSLVVFARSVLPKFTSHQIRQILSDL